MATKDTKLGDKEQYVVHGDILADSFRDRKTGKPVGDDSTEINSLKARVQALEGIIDLFFEYDEENEILKFKKEVECSKIHIEKISYIVDEDNRAIIPDSVAGKYIVGGSDFVYHTTDLPTE